MAIFYSTLAVIIEFGIPFSLFIIKFVTPLENLNQVFRLRANNWPNIGFPHSVVINGDFGVYQMKRIVAGSTGPVSGIH